MTDILFNNLLNRIQTNSKVLFIWSGQTVPENFQTSVERVQERVGADIKINVEHLDRLSLGNYEQSSFDVILCNILTPQEVDTKTLSVFVKLLKRKGFLVVFDNNSNSNLDSELKLNGFQNVSKELNGLVSFYAEKPNFEVGASSKLKFKSKESQQVWKLDQEDIQEDDLINTDDLLDDLDLKKPVLSESKFDCGTSASGKKKACKNCTCGLAEELENEASNKQKKNTQAQVKSACGSCYLGDAFRCASCPYLGMPAFKPGEKVQLAGNLTKSDL